MSNPENRVDTSRYARMTTEELQEILRKHAHGELETEPDTEELFEIMEALSARRQNADSPAFRSDEEAFSEFCGHYMPKEEHARPKVIGFPNRTFKTVAAVLALVLVLAVGTTLTAQAFHFDIWGKFASWTKDTFRFTDGKPGTTADQQTEEFHPEAKSLQDALLKEGITEKLAPTWLPEGYKNTDLSVQSNLKTRNFCALYMKGDSSLVISIRQSFGIPGKRIEKDDNLFEIYTVNNIDYYIFSNNANLQAAWTVGEFECLIGGQITLEEMKKMIDSI